MDYRIELGNPISTELLEDFPELTVRSVATDGVVLEGDVVDQARLHGLLHRVEALGLTLVSVTRMTGPGGPGSFPTGGSHPSSEGLL
ncbi:conserved hypothetical protein [Nostocoides japonicum T1-X7]|uniref:Uncharacterized protein n=1 Tax=Nostocoides japonicum T1-X7 TaxID=1194083 RepID=A0A077M095_9MICO|nr:hypothetical protein [Tetrasphaera japonica]CCH77635.1 conserved hypothetical protein [Tetrasphaera japonica T1-X7]